MEKTRHARPSKSEDENANSRMDDFEEKYNRSYRYVFNFIYRSIGNREDAEELTHDCLLKYHDYPEEVRNELGFLKTIASNKVKDYFRSKGAKKNKVTIVSLDQDDGLSLEELPGNAVDPVRKQKDEDERAERKRVFLRICEYVLNLTRDKELAPYILDDLGDEEVARRLSRDVVEVRNALSLARINLRRGLRNFLVEVAEAEVPLTLEGVEGYLAGRE
jgi:DNA-directed RNA polymerase specialized sigma24 family protein